MKQTKPEMKLPLLEKELISEKKKLAEIEANIQRINESLEKTPPDFSFRDVILSFFGALVIGITFVHKGSLVLNSIKMNGYHTIGVLLSTIIILLVVIYVIGYQKVKNKEARPLGQFMFKRFVTMYGTSLVVAVLLVYLFGINQNLPNNLALINTILSVAMPSAFGAAIVDLVKRY
mgnify:FL=1